MAQAMAQHSQDHYAQQTKALASSAQRLRGWVGSDPSQGTRAGRRPCRADGPPAVSGTAMQRRRQMPRRPYAVPPSCCRKGPLGPYTSITDAARYVTAVFSWPIQAGLGMPDAAGRTIESLRDMHDQLGDGLRSQLKPQTAIWALCAARGGTRLDGTSQQRMRTPTPPGPGSPDPDSMTSRTLPISRWTSTDWPRIPVGRRQSRGSVAFCMPPRSGTTTWSTVAFRSRHGLAPPY